MAGPTISPNPAPEPIGWQRAPRAPIEATPPTPSTNAIADVPPPNAESLPIRRPLSKDAQLLGECPLQTPAIETANYASFVSTMEFLIGDTGSLFQDPLNVSNGAVFSWVFQHGWIPQDKLLQLSESELENFLVLMKYIGITPSALLAEGPPLDPLSLEALLKNRPALAYFFDAAVDLKNERASTLDYLLGQIDQGAIVFRRFFRLMAVLEKLSGKPCSLPLPITEHSTYQKAAEFILENKISFEALMRLDAREWASWVDCLRYSEAYQWDPETYILPPLAANRDQYLTWCLEKPTRLNFVPKQFLEDPSFVAAVVVTHERENPGWCWTSYESHREFFWSGLEPSLTYLAPDYPLREFFKLPEEEKNQAWGYLQAQMRARGIFFPFRFSGYKEFFTRLAEHQLHRPDRFSLGELGQIFENRRDTRDPRKRLLMIYPTKDWNGAFASTAYEMNELSKEYLVLYYEINSKKDLLRALQEGTKNFTQPANTLVLGAHGNHNGQYFGSIGDREGQLVASSFYPGSKIAEALHQAVEGRVILASCANGSGRELLANFANTVANVVRNGVEVISSPQISGSTLSLNENHQAEITYRDDGGAVEPYLAYGSETPEYYSPNLLFGVNLGYLKPRPENQLLYYDGLGLSAAVGFANIDGLTLAAGLSYEFLFEKGHEIIPTFSTFYPLSDDVYWENKCGIGVGFPTLGGSSYPSAVVSSDLGVEIFRGIKGRVGFQANLPLDDQHPNEDYIPSLFLGIGYLL